jgi:hypothetical protein
VCDNINEIIPRGTACKTLDQKLHSIFKGKVINEDKLCDYTRYYDVGLMHKSYDLLHMEYINYKLGDLLEKYIEMISKKKNPNEKNDLIYSFVSLVDKIIFQVIFTLAVIHDKYPEFQHNDLFIRNILVIYEDSYNENDYIEYNYHGKKFYFEANGYHIKINDFGLSRMHPIIKSSTYIQDKKWYGIDHREDIDHHSDIFFFLYNLFVWDSIDSTSLSTICLNHKEVRLSKIIKSLFSKYVDTNKMILLNSTFEIEQFNIAGVKQLESLVKIPSEYLHSYFEHLELSDDLTDDENIVLRFNAHDH